MPARPGDFRVPEHATEVIPLNTVGVPDCACLQLVHFHADRINVRWYLHVTVIPSFAIPFFLLLPQTVTWRTSTCSLSAYADADNGGV